MSRRTGTILFVRDFLILFLRRVQRQSSAGRADPGADPGAGATLTLAAAIQGGSASGEPHRHRRPRGRRGYF